VLRDTELKVFLFLFAIAAAAMTADLFTYTKNIGSAAALAFYESAALISTSGAASVPIASLPSFTQAVLFILFIAGGCSMSLAGGIKIVRGCILWKQSGNELRRLVSPSSVLNVRLNKKIGRKDLVYSAASIFYLYMLVTTAATIIVCAGGVTLNNAFFTTIAAALNNGAVFISAGGAANGGVVGGTAFFAALPEYTKFLYSVIMIAGRVELIPVALLFTKNYRSLYG
jgi:trk system potassium uptake protein TrkH